MMTLIDQQYAKQRQILSLVVGVVIACVAVGLVIHVLVVSLSILFGANAQFSQLSIITMLLIFLFLVAVSLGAIMRVKALKKGAEKLAVEMGAVLAVAQSSNDKEQRLIKIVAEIASASSTPLPRLFILTKENTINAFVLSSQPIDKLATRHVLVVTQGALDHLDEDELRAVVAHEFARIWNNDISLNMYLFIALGGLMAIDDIGCFLLEKYSESRLSPIALIAYPMLFLGSIGVFFGQLLRSAFTHQRVYSADASAVQFTRNSYSLASALNEIRRRKDESALNTIFKKGLVHLSFHSGQSSPWLESLLASHPSLQNRISTIDPRYSVKYRKARKARDSTFGGKILPSTAQSSAETELSTGARMLLSDTPNSIALLFALNISADLSHRRNYFNAVTFAFNKSFAFRIKELARILSDDIKDNQLELTKHATKTICETVSRKDRQRLLAKLEGLASSSHDFDLMNYASLQFIRGELELEFPIVKTLPENHLAQGRHVKPFESMGGEIALLLSLVVESSGASEAAQKREFARVLKCYTQSNYPRRSKKEKGILLEVSAAFQTLYVQPKATKEAFLRHCADVVKRDGYIARAEGALLGLFAASLGCQQKFV